MNNKLRDVDKILATACLASLILLVVVQVVMRVVFLSPLIGAEELVRYFLICVVFLGAPFAVRNGGHIRMEEIQMWLPFWLRYSIRFLTFFGAVIAFGIIAYGSCMTLLDNLANRTATLSMPFPLFILPTVLGFLLMTVEYAILLFKFIRHSDIPRHGDKAVR